MTIEKQLRWQKTLNVFYDKKMNKIELFSLWFSFHYTMKILVLGFFNKYMLYHYNLYTLIYFIMLLKSPKFTEQKYYTQVAFLIMAIIERECVCVCTVGGNHGESGESRIQTWKASCAAQPHCCGSLEAPTVAIPLPLPLKLTFGARDQ